MGLLGGCAKSIFQSSSPTLDDLESLKVHVARIQSTEESDIFRIVYAVNVPFELVWEKALELPEWFKSAQNIEDIVEWLPSKRQRPAGEESSGSTGA